jgi:hypothetical protein
MVKSISFHLFSVEAHHLNLPYTHLEIAKYPFLSVIFGVLKKKVLFPMEVAQLQLTNYFIDTLRSDRNVS